MKRFGRRACRAALSVLLVLATQVAGAAALCQSVMTAAPGTSHRAMADAAMSIAMPAPTGSGADSSCCGPDSAPATVCDDARSVANALSTASPGSDGVGFAPLLSFRSGRTATPFAPRAASAAPARPSLAVHIALRRFLS
jgi:hypothetical protein